MGDGEMGEGEEAGGVGNGLPTRIDVRTADGNEDNIIVEDRGELAQDLGESDIQLFDLPNGMAININRFVPAQDMSLAFDPLDGKPRMVSIMLLAGEALLRYPTGEEYQFSESRGYNMRYQGAPGTFHLAAGREVRNFTVAAPPDILAGYLEGEVPPALINMIDPEEVTKAFTPFPVSLEMRRTVSEMIQPGLTGRLQEIQMESAALMYITLVARALEQEPPPSKLVSKAERDAAAAIYEGLNNSLKDPPTLSELSAEAGISEKRLNWLFREIYGGTVFEVLRDARLTIAKEMLETSDAPIKTVAWDVGYAHVSNFNRAFSRMFGVTPGAVAKNK